MARKPRIEIEGALYHVITRGNNRQPIFSSGDDYRKMLELLEMQKAGLPFYLYAYCLMPNHIHLLIERRRDPISRMMQRLLTGYTQYYNRRRHKLGHLLQGRYKAILCDTDQYLAELVRYIHLNPVRAKLAGRPEDWAFSGHRAYMGVEQSRLVDLDPLLRRFGAKKTQARERYVGFVRAGKRLGHREDLYRGGMIASPPTTTD
jgi:REP element-mobilizing transposase RayT